MKYETDPTLPWVHGPEGYIARPELTQQYEKNEDIGADSPPEVMMARALAYRASELTNYKKEFDDEIFSDYAMRIYQDYVLGKSGDRDQSLDSLLNRIDDGGWDDEEIMDIAMGGEYHSDDYPESEYPGMERNDDVMRADHEARQMAGDIPEDQDWYSLSEPGPALPHGHPSISTGPRDIVHARLGEIYEENALEADLAVWLEKNPEFTLVKPGTEYSGWWGTDVIDEESWYVDGPEEGPLNESRLVRLAGLNESLSAARSEVGYSPTKASRHALHKARRASASGEIDAQLASMEFGGEDDRTIGDIVPISKEEWDSYGGISPDPENNTPSEKMAYLYDLAYDVAYGREGSELSPEDIDKLAELIHDQFGFDWAQVVGGHDKPGGYAADASADAARDEYYDDTVVDSRDRATIFNEARFARLAGLNETTS